MKADQIKKLCDTVPFKPFVIHLSNQRYIHIPHQDFLWIIPGGRTIGVADHDGVAQLIDIIHIVSLVTMNGTTA